MDRWINVWLVDGRSVDHSISLSVLQLINLLVNQSTCFNCPSFSPNIHDSFIRVLYWGV